MDIATKVARLKEDLDKRIQEIEKLESYLFRDICLFAVTEQYAQDFGGYKKGCNEKMFVDFLGKYANEPILANYSPVTLYYFNQEYFESNNIDLSYLVKYENSEVLASIISSAPETAQIISQARKINNKFVEKHKYSNLIYKYRSKLSHELHSPFQIWQSEQSINEPYNRWVISISSEEDSSNGRWEVRFPYTFLKKCRLLQYMVTLTIVQTLTSVHLKTIRSTNIGTSDSGDMEDFTDEHNARI